MIVTVYSRSSRLLMDAPCAAVAPSTIPITAIAVARTIVALLKGCTRPSLLLGRLLRRGLLRSSFLLRLHRLDPYLILVQSCVTRIGSGSLQCENFLASAQTDFSAD